MKTSLKSRIGVLALLLAAFALILPMSAGPDRALVRSLIGSAEVIRDGKTESLRVGAIVKDSDRIRTGRQSQVIVFYKGIEIRLLPETDATLVSLTEPGKPAGVQIQKGFGWFNIKDPSRRGFEASTPTSVAAVRGTKFALGHDASGSTSCVCEGKVATRPASGGNESVIQAGGSHEYAAAGGFAAHDFQKYFKGLKVDRSFQQEILRDQKLNNCKSCHRMTNVATDQTPDPGNY
jgi:hypothetical protein